MPGCLAAGVSPGSESISGAMLLVLSTIAFSAAWTAISSLSSNTPHAKSNSIQGLPNNVSSPSSIVTFSCPTRCRLAWCSDGRKFSRR